MKPSPLKFSPEREKEILKNCPREALDIYISILSTSRIWPAGAKWFFIRGGNKDRDELALLYFHKIFGGGIKISETGDIETLFETARNSSGNKPVFVISQSSSWLKKHAGELFFKHADYKKGARKLFEFYSDIAPDGEKCVTINL